MDGLHIRLAMSQQWTCGADADAGNVRAHPSPVRRREFREPPAPLALLHIRPQGSANFTVAQFSRRSGSPLPIGRNQ